MRTKTTKEVEAMAFEQLSTWSIVIGASKVLLKRHMDILGGIVIGATFVALLWIKIG